MTLSCFYEAALLKREGEPIYIYVYLDMYIQRVSSRKIEVLNKSPWDLVMSLKFYFCFVCWLCMLLLLRLLSMPLAGWGTGRMLDKSSDNHERPCAILVMDAVLVMRAPSAVDDGLDMCIQASTYHDPKVSQNTTRN